MERKREKKKMKRKKIIEREFFFSFSILHEIHFSGKLTHFMQLLTEWYVQIVTCVLIWKIWIPKNESEQKNTIFRRNLSTISGKHAVDLYLVQLPLCDNVSVWVALANCSHVKNNRVLIMHINEVSCCWVR